MYELEPEDDVVPRRFTGTAIEWKAGKDVTVEETKRRVKGGKVRRAREEADTGRRGSRPRHAAAGSGRPTPPWPHVPFNCAG